MSITVLPPNKSGLDELVEAFLASYLPGQALGREYMLKKRMAEQEYARTQPWEEQKALIAAGMAQPISTQIGQYEQGANAFQQRHSQAPYPIPENIKQQILQRRTPDFTSPSGMKYKNVPSLEREKTQSQIDLNKMISNAYKGGTSGQRIFRDLTTGEEVDEQTALMGMGQGKQYNVFLRTPTRSGVRESKIAEPRKLSENEVDFVSSYEQNKKDLESLIEKLTPETKAPVGGFARISTRQRWMVPEKNLRELQAPYTRVVKAFLFGPAGKALTGTEREVLERAASATGKSPTEWETDLQAGLKVINDKYEYLTTKTLPTSGENGQQNSSDPLGLRR